MDHHSIKQHLEYFLTQTQCVVSDDFVCFVSLYLETLAQWNRVHNLTRVPDGLPALYRHILESLALLPLMSRHLSPGAVCVDVGTGAGIPGLIVAAASSVYHLHLVDPVAKKISFIRYVLARYPIPTVSCHQQRIESWSVGACHGILSRAFADVTHLVACTYAHCHPSALWFAMVSQPPDQQKQDWLWARYGVRLRALYHQEEVWPSDTAHSVFLSSDYGAQHRYVAILGFEL